jgi:hypothetical protein
VAASLTVSVKPYAGFAAGVLHFVNSPFSRHLVAFGLSGGHLMNLPFASLQGAETAGSAVIGNIETARRTFNMRLLLGGRLG